MFLYFKSQLFEWKEQRQVRRRYYQNMRFHALDRALLDAYRERSPYQISKSFLMSKGARVVDAYGETPLTTMDRIVTECQLKGSDTVLEMGAGRGRCALFLAEYIGCRVIAYEQIARFVEKMVPCHNLRMVQGDMFQADFSQFNVIYLYGTMLLDEEIVRLVEQFPLNVKIITVSYPLKDYSEKYETKKNFPGYFPWGKTEVYWNERTCR